MAALAGSFVLSLVAGVVVALFFAFQARREAAAARASEARAKEAQEWSERRWYAAEMGLAQQNWENGQPARLRSRLAALRPASNSATDLRGFEWYFLERLSRLELRTLSGHAEPVESVAFSPDGRLLASAGGQYKRGEPGVLRIWDSTSGEAIHTWVGHAERVNCVVFSPDGRAAGLFRWGLERPRRGQALGRPHRKRNPLPGRSDSAGLEPGVQPRRPAVGRWQRRIRRRRPLAAGRRLDLGPGG